MPDATVTFLGTDTLTQGTWRGVYGVDGYYIPIAGTSYPAYVTAVRSGATNEFSYDNPSVQARAVQKPSPSTERILSVWFNPVGTITLELQFSSAVPRIVRFYSVDGDTTTRSQRIDVKDYTSGNVLDTRTVAASFADGIWHSWQISGDVKILVTLLAGTTTSVGAVMFDTPASVTARRRSAMKFWRK